jgi:hypothetical protein
MANGTAKEKLGNVSTKRDKPSRYGKSIGSVAAGSTIEFVAVVDAVVSGTADLTGDKWFKLPDNSYVNYILAGIPYYVVLTQPSGTLPPLAPILTSIEIKPAVGSVITKKYSDGTSKTETV